MSVLVTSTDNTERESLHLTTTPVAIYTGRASTAAKGVNLVLANKTAAAVAVTVSVYDAAKADTFHIYSSYSLDPNATLDHDFHGLRILEGDEIRVSAASNNAVDATINVVIAQGREGGRR